MEFFNSLEMAKREEHRRWSTRAKDAAARCMGRALMACTTCTWRKQVRTSTKRGERSIAYRLRS